MGNNNVMLVSAPPPPPPLLKRSPTLPGCNVNVSTLGSDGGSYCMIQSTSGMSKPRAATSVQIRIPSLALQNLKKV